MLWSWEHTVISHYSTHSEQNVEMTQERRFFTGLIHPTLSFLLLLPQPRRRPTLESFWATEQ